MLTEEVIASLSALEPNQVLARLSARAKKTAQGLSTYPLVEIGTREKTIRGALLSFTEATPDRTAVAILAELDRGNREVLSLTFLDAAHVQMVSVINFDAYLPSLKVSSGAPRAAMTKMALDRLVDQINKSAGTKGWAGQLGVSWDQAPVTEEARVGLENLLNVMAKIMTDFVSDSLALTALGEIKTIKIGFSARAPIEVNRDSSTLLIRADWQLIEDQDFAAKLKSQIEQKI